MTNGTTPTLRWTFGSGIDTADIDAAYMTIRCSNGQKIEKDLESASLGDKQILWTLTQAETLLLTPEVDIQLRWRIGENAYASSIKTINVEKILKKGVI